VLRYDPRCFRERRVAFGFPPAQRTIEHPLGTFPITYEVLLVELLVVLLVVLLWYR
jgi:hypothetical protein